MMNRCLRNNARVKIREQLLQVLEWTKESKTWNGECEPAAGGIRPTNRLGAATATIRGVWIAINPEKCETRATEAYTVRGKKVYFNSFSANPSVPSKGRGKERNSDPPFLLLGDRTTNMGNGYLADIIGPCWKFFLRVGWMYSTI
jgi:hypothetical protein